MQQCDVCFLLELTFVAESFQFEYFVAGAELEMTD